MLKNKSSEIQFYRNYKRIIMFTTVRHFMSSMKNTVCSKKCKMKYERFYVEERAM